MTIYWSDSALERSGIDPTGLLMLTGDKYDLAVVREWRANLHSGRPVGLAEDEISKITERYPHLFGRR